MLSATMAVDPDSGEVLSKISTADGDYFVPYYEPDRLAILAERVLFSGEQIKLWEAMHEAAKSIIKRDQLEAVKNYGTTIATSARYERRAGIDRKKFREAVLPELTTAEMRTLLACVKDLDWKELPPLEATLDPAAHAARADMVKLLQSLEVRTPVQTLRVTRPRQMAPHPVKGAEIREPEDE